MFIRKQQVKKNTTIQIAFCGQTDSKSNVIISGTDIVLDVNPCALFIDYVTESAVPTRLWDIHLFSLMLGHINNPWLNIKAACIINTSDHRTARCVDAVELVIRLIQCDGCVPPQMVRLHLFVPRWPDVPRTLWWFSCQLGFLEWSVMSAFYQFASRCLCYECV